MKEVMPLGRKDISGIVVTWKIIDENEGKK